MTIAATLERAAEIGRPACATCGGHGYVNCIPREGGPAIATLCGNCDEAARNPHGRKGDWIQTYPTGLAYWPLDPRPAEVRLVDIAHHLSNLCRFTGACSEFYSVAEHAVHVSHIVPPHLALAALHHDDPEYVCNDLARPVKYAVEGYREVEALNAEAIRVALRLPVLSEADEHLIKTADNAMLLAEAEVLTAPRAMPWNPVEVPDALVARARECLADMPRLAPFTARTLYLQRHAELRAA